MSVVEYVQPYFQIKGFLPSLALAFTWSAFMFRFRVGMWSLALLAFPGTAAHEFAHFIVGLILWAKPQHFTVWPRRSGNSWIFGSVSFRGINLLNAAFVAMAPLLLLPLAWLCLIHITTMFWISDRLGWWFFSGYLTASFLFGCIPSSQDFKVGGSSLMLYGTVGASYMLCAFTWASWHH